MHPTMQHIVSHMPRHRSCSPKNAPALHAMCEGMAHDSLPGRSCMVCCTLAGAGAGHSASNHPAAEPWAVYASGGWQAMCWYTKRVGVCPLWFRLLVHMYLMGWRDKIVLSSPSAFLLTQVLLFSNCAGDWVPDVHDLLPDGTCCSSGKSRKMSHAVLT
jgi:hypothetical protein